MTTKTSFMSMHLRNNPRMPWHLIFIDAEKARTDTGRTVPNPDVDGGFSKAP